LAGERQRIERTLAQLGHEDTGEPADEEDPANLASDLYQDELDEGLAEDLREELAAVERAEARLAAGTYGFSIESGKPIPDERLEAVRRRSGRSTRRRTEGPARRGLRVGERRRAPPSRGAQSAVVVASAARAPAARTAFVSVSMS
jgi:DnaK suppressor protein